MQRVVAILFFLISIMGCSSSRKSHLSPTFINNNRINTINDLTQSNLTQNNFDIQKIDIQFKNREIEETFIANLKFREPDEYLISLRTKIGIEIARVNIKNDSIFIIDKINKILYKGSNSYLESYYGLSNGLMPLLIGDVLISDEENNSNFQCVNNPVYKSYYNSYIINYNINCETARPNGIDLKDSYNRTTIFNYTFKSNSDKKLVPDQIKVLSDFFGYEINMEFNNYIFNPSSKILFDTSDINGTINLGE